jgi:hypothetical protein
MHGCVVFCESRKKSGKEKKIYENTKLIFGYEIGITFV